MFAETDLLPISALQHLVFCERQWALIHLEGIWEENRLTVEGHFLHERSDTPETEVRGDTRIARGLRLRSLELGLVGKADVVEFHRISTGSGATLPNVDGLWGVEPVEYKRGKPKTDRSDEVQLCAQALCLEEMLDVGISSGALFYGRPHRRYDVVFDESLRAETMSLIVRLRDLVDRRQTPQVKYGRKCRNCSLIDSCMPKVTGQRRDVQHYLNDALEG